ncbi:hypothetical protein SLE2022_283720 [Rubroshorea leprosula]
MGDLSHSSGSNRNSEVTSATAGKKSYKGKSVALGFPRNTCKHISSLTSSKGISGVAGQATIFLLKVAALETVRRVSRAKCPHIWHGFQALQVLCYPPLNFIQKWAPFKGLVRGLQMLSRPLLVLSVATVFSNQAESSNEASDGINASPAYSEHPEPSTTESTLDTRSDDEASQNGESEDWLIQLHKELENQGISLPERMNKEELCRFHTSANGDFSYFLSSIKKTIRWRETYRILSQEELVAWSNMVFWHGYDVKQRPCLIVRLGLASLNLPAQERPRFAQAVVSQVEHGVLHLVAAENPEVTVVVDCHGLPPLRIPMQILRSCSSILQENYPNRLGSLFIIQLPPVIRVLTQTFIQVLKPITRKKLKIEGEMYHKVLSEYLLTLPSYLGGDCTCTKCSASGGLHMRHYPLRNGINRTVAIEDLSNSEDMPSHDMTSPDDINSNGSCDQVLRTAIIAILMVWVLLALVAGLFDPESRPF